MDKNKIKLVAFDLDGTLTQHKSKLNAENRAVLERLRQKYRLLMVGAGTCRRIFEQMERFPIDIIGNYGMQYAKYDVEKEDITVVRDVQLPVDREAVEATVTKLRKIYGYTDFKGENVEYHPSGCVTFPILGTKADLADKLAFDPDRAKRRKIYADVKSHFPNYIVFVGGSSSFDMAPAPYDKAYALDVYCRENGLSHDEVAYVGDDYGMGGNDESVYLSDFNYITIDDYRTLEEKMKSLLWA
ncbi:MAG: HAD-IIB family hydrolase [Clostridia bacterium]|nr:HAD-IIB family hydrolase [Clostridia bacterium]